MTTHLPHWSKLSFHKKPTKLVTPADTSSSPPMVQTAARRPASTVFTDEGSPRTTTAEDEDKGHVGGTEDESDDEEGNPSKKDEIESKETEGFIAGLVSVK